MSRSIRISERTAKALLEHIEPPGKLFLPWPLAFAASELRTALKPKKFVVLHAKRVRSKRATKRQETSAIYEAVAKRADGHCEACGWEFVGWEFVGSLGGPELDHAEGRRVRQSVANTWLIHQACHSDRHHARPNVVYWLNLWMWHCKKHGYTAEASRARARLESLELMEQAQKVGAK